MAEFRYRVRVGDYRYGPTCPRCASPKSLQAARCQACYADDKRTGRRRPIVTVRASCPDCGGPMWSTSMRCRSCWLEHADKTNPAGHPWARSSRRSKGRSGRSLGRRRTSVADDALFMDYRSLIPKGISVHRDPYSGLGRQLRFYVIRDSDKRIERVEVDPDEYEVEWTPPPKVPWWHWLEPLGAALDSADRNSAIGRMRGKKVVDWDAVNRELREQGAAAVQRLLTSGPGGRDDA